MSFYGYSTRAVRIPTLSPRLQNFITSFLTNPSLSLQQRTPGRYRFRCFCFQFLLPLLSVAQCAGKHSVIHKTKNT